MKVTHLNPDQRIVRSVLGTILLLVIVFSFVFDPSTYNLIDCYFHNITGLPCPSCGLTRSFHSMSHLRIAEAFQLNWMGPLLFALLSISCLQLIITSVSGRFVVLPYSSKLGVVILIFVWVLAWLLRLIFGF